MSFTIHQLASSVLEFNISDNNIVWTSKDYPSNLGIYLYDGSNTIQLTNSDVFVAFISGNNVVWSYDAIYLYNGNSIIQLPNSSADSLLSYGNTISGNNVVWINNDINNYEIYLYNGNSTIQVTDNNYYEIDPQISGNNVVWESSEGIDSEIYLYNGDSTLHLTDSSFDDYFQPTSYYSFNHFPKISGNNVVWFGSDNNDYEIYLYNGNSTIQLTDNNYDDFFPQISGNNVVWYSYDGNDSEIYLYNGNSTIQLTDNNYDDFYPQISGNNVVWYSYDGNDSEIYLYNGNSTIQVTDNNYDDTEAQISGNNVAWVSGDNLFFTTLPLWSSVTTTLSADIFDLILTGADNINGYGNSLNNTITGNEANNLLFGKSGDDTLLGSLGSDRLVGGIGADTLTGGAGADYFICKYSDTGVDTITDFNVAEDKFLVSASGFGGELVSGAVITIAQFTVGEAALDESDRFIYDSTTGGLFFDADGTGSSETIQVAQLSSDLALTHANIFVFA
jgi:beta propeller repeat protein